MPGIHRELGPVELAAALASFRRDGFIVFEGLLSAADSGQLRQEILRCEEVQAALDGGCEVLGREVGAQPLTSLYSMGSATSLDSSAHHWLEPGSLSDRLADPPLIRGLLRHIIGPTFHLSTAGAGVKGRDTPSLRFHQDHWHWRSDYPVNLAARDSPYLQLLWYPDGFAVKDASLMVVPGSHAIDPLIVEPLPFAYIKDAETKLLATHGLSPVELAPMPPGSLVFMNARTYHAVTPKPASSPTALRLSCKYTYKGPGPPMAGTMIVPEGLLRAAREGDDPVRRMLLEREAFTYEAWGMPPDDTIIGMPAPKL